MGLTNEQYNTIMRDYQRQQARNRQELAARTDEIYARFPEFSEIDAAIASKSTSCARRMLSDDDTVTCSAEELRRQIAELSGRRGQILKAAGYPDDYLTMRYRCADCQDTGYIGSKKCHCFRQAAIDLLYTQSNLKEALATENFSSFSLAYYSDQITDPVTGLTAAQTAKRTLEECRRFVTDFDRSFENLFLYGDTGLGKTFLSHCIARELLESAHSVIYFSSFRLFELFADSTFGRSDSDTQAELEQHIFDCDFLIIDDLGTELVNSFVASQLFHVLNERILRRKSTLISTNLSIGTFADTYSERVFSRISSNYLMLKLIGDDIRLQKKISAGRA
jgi:DNA replication protein DnaC